jgi:hypothetical protein
MYERSTPSPARATFTSLIFLSFFFTVLCGEASAGTGTFRKTGPGTGVFDFCVSVRFTATDTQLARIRQGFDAASQVLADATDGRHRFGTVNIINNGGAQEVAEFWVNPGNNRAGAAAGFYGDPRGRANLYFLANFGGDSTNTAAILDSAYAIAHEFAHLAYNLRDEYPVTSAEIASGAECAPPPIPPKTFKDEPNLSYCLMDNFYARGGWSAGLRTFTLNEFCVASNHDKPNANGVGANNTPQQRAHGKSCWQTIASLQKPWPLLPPPDLPLDAAPPYQPVNFGTQCGNKYVMLLIDSSDSMFGDITKIANAIIATGEYINSFKLGDYLSIAAFADIQRVGLPFTQITDEAARYRAEQGLVDAIMFDRSGTNIGGSLLWARDYMSANTSCPTSCEKTIILLTDGRHNVGLPASFATEPLVDAGIKLVAVNVGERIPQAAQLELQNVSTATSGQYHRVGFAPEAQGAFDATDLIALFMELGRAARGHGTVFHQRAAISSNQTKEFQILLEPGAAGVAFAVTIDNSSDDMTLTLRTPSGATISGPSGADIQFRSDGTRRVFQLNNPQAGTWKAVVTSGAVTTGRLEVLSFADHVGVSLLPNIDNDNVLSTEPVTITASPTYDSLRVVGASVTGTVTHPNGTQSSIILYDDGSSAHGDASASDGVYSTLFNGYSVDGTYVAELTSVNATGHTYAGEPLSEGAVATEMPVPPFTRLGSVTFIASGLEDGELVWIDDALPRGAKPSGEWYWVEANPAPIMGGAGHQSKISPSGLYTVDEHSFVGATAKMALAAGDNLFAYVFLDPNASPQEIMLQWHADDGWEHRAYWGANYLQLGSDGTNGRRFMGALPAAGQWVRLEVPAAAVGLEGKVIDGMAFTTNGNRATWDRTGRLRGESSPPSAGDFVWVDDSRPAGSVEVNKDDIWDWVNIPGPYTGQLCHRSILRGDRGTGRLRTHGFTRAQTPMKVEPGDVLYTYVYIDPNYRPDEIMLQWEANDNWEHRAYWGNNFVDLGVTGAESRRYMGALPPVAQWVRLEIPASYVGLEGKSVTGMSFGYYKQNDQARVSWDLAGKTSQPMTAPYPLSSLTPLYRFRADSYGYSYSTNDIGRAEQSIEGVRAYVNPLQAAGTVPLYRFRDRDDGRYFYFVNKTAPDPTWYYDGVAFYIYPGQVPGTVALHQFYGRYSGSKQGYFYTTNQDEGYSLGFTYQGVAGHVHDTNPLVPAAPSRARIGSSSGMRWNDNSSNESGFKIEYKDRVSGWQEIGAVGANVTSFWSSHMKECGSLFRVRAFNGVGYSAYSGQAGAGSFNGLWSCIYLHGEPSNSPPTANIVLPADGATFKAGANVQVKAEAFDADGNGTIAKVEFFLQGEVKLGEATQPPYMYSAGSAPAGTYNVTATATDASGLSATSAPITVTVQPVVAGDVIISEFRLRGGGGQLDEFVELYNNTDFNITVGTTDGSGGWSLVDSDGSVRFTIPNGTTIPARGHFLGVNASAYSLGAYASADTEWFGDIADGAGLALFRSSTPSNFTNDYRLDSVGFSSVADARFREGAGLQPSAGINASTNFSFMRRLNSSTPSDANDNAADFLFISTDGINSGGVQSALGAPGPEGLGSPVQRNSSFGFTVLDPAVNSSTPPNRVRDFTSDPANNSTFGTLAIRRTATNDTGAPVTRLRFRVTDMTTYPVPSGVADMRLRSSGTVQVTRTDGSVVTAQAMTLQTPPAQPNGGGFNSTVAVGTITLPEPLQPGASVHVQFLLGLQSTGSFRFFINIEAGH